jgi:hypothetical protein
MKSNLYYGSILISLFFLFWETANAQNQNWAWAKRLGGTNNDQGFAIAVDGNGNVFTAGYFETTSDFDPGSGVFNLTSAGGPDVFISKLNSSGHFVWAKAFSGTLSEVARGIATDSAGNVYLTGYFQGTVDFDPGPATYNLTAVGGSDIFIAKLDGSGNFLWAKVMSGPGFEESNCIKVDASGNIYTAGFFYDTVDFDPGSGTFNITAYNSYNAFISKLDNSGNFVWAKKMGGPNEAENNSIAIDVLGNIYYTGEFRGTADFCPGPGIFTLVSAGKNDVFIAKLDSSGNFLWAKQMGNWLEDVGYSIDIDNSGNAYVTGSLSDQIFISKFDSSGNFNWTKLITGSYNVGYAIAFDPSGNGSIYTTGCCKGTVDFDPGPGVYNINLIGYLDVFISKLDTAGNFIMAKRYGGIDNETAYALCLDHSGNIYSTGGYLSSVLSVASTSLFSAGYGEVFIDKLYSCKVSSTVYLTSCNSYTSPSTHYTWINSGVYFDTIPSLSGCDSIITIYLTINSINTSSSQTISSCDSYISPSALYTWASSGTYLDTIPNADGCDSVVTTFLTIINSTSSSFSDSGCNSYLSPSGNYTWTNSGLYLDTIPNTAGCDSIISVDLTLSKTFSSMADTACNNYLSPSGNFFWTASGIYNDTLTNAAGCDSIITFNLTLNKSYSTLTVQSCFNYLSPSGKYVWTTSGAYLDTLTNAAGCDSIINVNLSVNTINVSVTLNNNVLSAISSGGIYQWLDCNNGFTPVTGATSATFNPAVDGNYAVSITKFGCTDTSACYTVTGVGIHEINSGNFFEIFPNPADENFAISLQNYHKISGINIKDITGRTMYSINKVNSQLMEVKTADLPAGVYLIQIKSEGITETKKLIISR